MAKFTSRADLLIAAGESIKMQEKAEIEPVCKIDKDIEKLSYVSFILDEDRYEFPLAVVEGKPVFVGDELYGNDRCAKVNQRKLQVDSKMESGDIRMTDGGWFGVEYLSWSPPKPATVMVELLREDAETLKNWHLRPPICEKLSIACLKALEKA